jgi:hypothetical protein
MSGGKPKIEDVVAPVFTQANSIIPGGDGIVDGVKGMFGGGGDKEAPNSGALATLQGEALSGAQESATEYGGQQQNRADFGNALAQGAMGKGPSLAQAQLQQAQDRSLAQQVAAAKANRAVNPALAARQSAQLGAQMQQANAQNAAQATLQEQRQQQAAYQTYLNSLQNSRTGMLGAGTGAASALAAAQANQNAQNSAFTGNLLKTGAALAPVLMAASDRKLKTGIKKEGSKAKVKNYADGGIVEVNQGPGAQSYDYYARMFQKPEEEKEATDMSGLKDLFKGKTSTAGGALGVDTDFGYGMTDPIEQQNALGNLVNPADNFGAMPKASPTSMLGTNLVFNKGAIVPGKAKVPGDDIENDTVHAKLSPGEMVIPRTEVAKGPDGVKAFAEALLKQNKKQKGVDSEDFSPKSFLDALQPYSYKYKGGIAGNETAGEGRYLSVMAQDLEKAGPVGKSMVQDTEQGKVVNYSKGFGAMLAAQADLNQRLADIEARYSKKGK